METRTVVQVKLYFLCLNPMTEKTEEVIPVIGCTSKEELIKWYKEQFAPNGYNDGNWYKVFKVGSPLEWFNPVDVEMEIGIFGEGIQEIWIYLGNTITVPLLDQYKIDQLKSEFSVYETDNQNR